MSRRRRLPPLHALRAFEVAARHSSFKDAAEELAVTPTAVSHHVRLLENSLGVKLFERRARAVELTPEGAELYPVLREGFDSFAEAIARLQAPRHRTIVTLSATVAFAARWLVPRAPAFHRANPLMDLRLHASNQPAELRNGSADAAIRYGRGDYAGLKAELLLRDVFAPVCRPTLNIRRPADLAKQTLIHFEWHRTRRDTPVWPRWLKEAGVEKLEPKSQLILSDETQAIQAAIAGQGVALLSLLLVSDELASGALVRPLEPTLEAYHYYFVYPESQTGSARIAALRTWIRSELERFRTSISSRQI